TTAEHRWSVPHRENPSRRSSNLPRIPRPSERLVSAAAPAPPLQSCSFAVGGTWSQQPLHVPKTPPHVIHLLLISKSNTLQRSCLLVKEGAARADPQSFANV
ncbi:hypothetical protein M430DRAFT_45686, partial [Amorphotheca resinae ATCC 22711]